MHNSIKIDFEGIALEDGGTLVKDVPYVVGLKNFHFILSNLSLGGVIQNDISAEGIVTLESVIENEGQEDEFTSYHQQIVFKNVYGYDVTLYDKSVTCVVSPSGQDVLDAIAGGTLDNAKPIYYHGIRLAKTVNKEAFFCGCILNNSIDAIDSIDKFVAWMRSFDTTVYFTGNGVITYNGNFIQIFAIFKRANQTSINIMYNAGTEYEVINNVNLSDYFNNVDDGVNKIN